MCVCVCVCVCVSQCSKCTSVCLVQVHVGIVVFNRISGANVTCESQELSHDNS